MAHFLDPELEALRTGRTRPAQQGSASAPAGRRTPNKFGKSCHGCKTWVAPKSGYLGKANGGWVVYCPKCP